MGRLDSELWRFKLRGSLIRHLPLSVRIFVATPTDYRIGQQMFSGTKIVGTLGGPLGPPAGRGLINLIAPQRGELRSIDLYEMT